MQNNLKYQIIKELELRKGQTTSGQHLADVFGVSRNAVWKAMQLLKIEGYQIKSIPNKGYQLTEGSNVLSAAIIEAHLKDSQSYKIEVMQTVDSTSAYAKRALSGTQHLTPALYISEEQTEGQGRKGPFYSPQNQGIYMSYVTTGERIGETDPIFISYLAACSTIKAIQSFGDIPLDIRGVNNIYLNNLRVAGIMCEAVYDIETSCMKHIIVGVGVNVSNQDFPNELSGKAISLLNYKVDRNILIARLVNELSERFQVFSIDQIEKEYQSYLKVE